jgi:hypothetical protein
MLTALIILGLLIGGWAIWFLYEFIRYVASGEYATDKRLRDVSR